MEGKRRNIIAFLVRIGFGHVKVGLGVGLGLVSVVGLCWVGFCWAGSGWVGLTWVRLSLLGLG